MEAPTDPVQLSFGERTDGSHGRPVGCPMASARVTAEELKMLERAAALDGKPLVEWARDVLLREARTPRADAQFPEVVALRTLLNLILKPLAVVSR